MNYEAKCKNVSLLKFEAVHRVQRSMWLLLGYCRGAQTIETPHREVTEGKHCCRKHTAA